MQARSQPRGARLLGDILKDLVKSRSFPKPGPHKDVAAAWNRVAGPEAAVHARVVGLRGGILDIIVESPALYHELATFRKAQLLADVKEQLPEYPIRDIRFRHV